MRRLISFLLLATAAATPLAAQNRDWQNQRQPRGDGNDWRADRADRAATAPVGQNRASSTQELQAGPREREQFGRGYGADPRRSDMRADNRAASGSNGNFAPRPGPAPAGDLAQRPAGRPDGGFGRPDSGRGERLDSRRGHDRENGFAGRPGVGPNRSFGFRDRNRSNAGFGWPDGPRDGYSDRPGYGLSGGYAGRPGDWRDDRQYDRGARWSSGWRNDRRYDWQGYRAANRNLFRAPRYYGPRGYDYAPWRRGYRVQPFFYGENFWINDPWRYRLPPAGDYYRWVRYYDDIALIDLRSGLIEDIIYSFFWR